MKTLRPVGWLVLALIACAPPPLVDQDVSFLVPLAHARLFFPASQVAGDGAALISRALFDRLPALTVTDDPDALYAALSTVGVRLDPCFSEGAGLKSCQPQVRLVLQPVFDSADGLTTRDAAIHVFFSVTQAELERVVRELSLLREKSGVGAPDRLTGAHPGFDNQAWVDKARTLLLPLLRTNRVVRATAMSLHPSNEAWVFSGVEVSAGTFTDLAIPTLSPAVKGHVTSTGARETLTITLDPPSFSEPTLSTVLQNSSRWQASDLQLATAVQAVLRLENPEVHNPGTVDCASCHVAATVKWFLVNQSPAAGVDSLVPSSDVYADSRALRAFGYFFQAPAVSPRVQRETSAVRSLFAHRLEP